MILAYNGSVMEILKYRVEPFPTDSAHTGIYYARLQEQIVMAVATGDVSYDGKLVEALTPDGKAWIDAVKVAGYESPLSNMLKDWVQLSAWRETFSKALSFHKSPEEALAEANGRFPKAVDLMNLHGTDGDEDDDAGCGCGKNCDRWPGDPCPDEED